VECAAQADGGIFHRARRIEDSTVNALGVAEVDDETATATVDVTFEENSGIPRFLITWDLVKAKDGNWKPSLYARSYGPARRGPPDCSDGFDSLSEGRSPR
jgi:hypothetical protein